MNLTSKLSLAVLFSFLAACGPAAPDDTAESEQALGTLEYDVAGDPPGLFESVSWNMYRETSWGRAGFKKDGDKFLIQDEAADGQSVSVHWKTSYGRQGLCRDISGVATTGQWRWCDKNFIEGSTISMRIGRCNASYSNPCTHLDNYTGWTSWVSVVNNN